MVSQGVKNPLIDLTALEDKTLDEVSTWQKYKKKKLFQFRGKEIFLLLKLVQMLVLRQVAY